MRFQTRQSDAFIFAIGVTLLIFFFTLVFINSGIKSLNSQIKAKQAEYEKVLALYNKMEKGSSSKKEFRGDILIFVQKLESLGDLKNKIVSVSATGINGGVSVRMVTLNLPQLVEVFKTIEKYGNIEISQFTIKRNFSSEKLVDLSIVLRKRI